PQLLDLNALGSSPRVTNGACGKHRTHLPLDGGGSAAWPIGLAKLGGGAGKRRRPAYGTCPPASSQPHSSDTQAPQKPKRRLIWQDLLYPPLVTLGPDPRALYVMPGEAPGRLK